jgi:hypothetical protein
MAARVSQMLDVAVFRSAITPNVHQLDYWIKIRTIFIDEFKHLLAT